MNKIYDKNGTQIVPGDTVKYFHFIGARRKKHYMYKFVKGYMKDNKFLRFLHMTDPENLSDSFPVWIDGRRHGMMEVIQGYGKSYGKRLNQDGTVDVPAQR